MPLTAAGTLGTAPELALGTATVFTSPANVGVLGAAIKFPGLKNT